jgi:excisionase family DNA binding protein
MTDGTGAVRSVQTPAPLLVTVVEAAAILGVGRTKVYELIDRGQLRPVHIGRSLRVPVAELEEFVEALRASGRA